MRLKIFLLLVILAPSVSGQTASSVPAQVSNDTPEKVSVEKTSSVSDSADGSQKSVAKNKISIPPEKINPVRVARFSAPPVIDGQLDETAWQDAPVLKNFYQILPGDNIAPAKQTEVRIGYDEKHLYFGFRAFDEPDKVRASVAKRDAVLSDDNVRIFLDTFNDERRAYLLFFNPLGIQQDGILTEGTGPDFSVDLVMESKGVLTGDGYTVEVAVPFKSLRYEAGENKLWGIDFIRFIQHANGEASSWMPRDRNVAGTLRQIGKLTGLEDISTERTLELIPSLTVSESGRRVRTLPRQFAANPALLDPGRFLNEPIKFEPGLTAKFGIAPNITLDSAINPDFAQVETDSPVVTANQRFPIFFEEKRPFFLEGIEIFRTVMGVVNTRAIVDPDFAVKLTGKRGRNTFGLLAASDNAPGNYSQDERDDQTLRPAIERFLDKNSFAAALRLKRDIGSDGEVGLFATSYDFVERHNRLAGFDGRLRVDGQTLFNYQIVGTASRRFFFDQETGRNLYRTGNGFGYYYNLNRTTRNWQTILAGVGRTRDYRADIGFTPRVNTNRAELFLRYNSEANPKGKLVSWNFVQFQNILYDWKGRTQGWSFASYPTFNFQKQSFILLGIENIYERLFEEEFESFGGGRTATRAGAFFGAPERSANNFRILFGGGSVPHKKISFRVNGNYNFAAFDLDLGNGRRFPRVSPAALAASNAKLDPGTGRQLNLTGNFVYQPTDALRFSLDYTKSRLARGDTGRRAFDVNIYTLRAAYQFSSSIFARARIDYATLAGSVRGQFVAGWTPNPGTAVYLGYNNDLNYNGFSLFTNQPEAGFARNNQTFFVKLSYLFQRSF